jgi:hypothetical protein
MITFVTGNVHRIKNEKCGISGSENDYGDFYFYTINRPVTISDNQKKQLEWVPETKIKFQPKLIVDFPDSDQVTSGECWNAAHIENNQSNALGLPFPGGVVRVSRKDSQGKNWYVGDDCMDDVKSNTSFAVKINTVNDIIATRKKVLEQGKENNYIIEVKNNKKKPFQVLIRDYKCAGRLLTSNHNNYVEKNSYIEWSVRLEAGQSTKINYTLLK